MSSGVTPLQDIFCSGQQGFELDSRFEVSGIDELNEVPTPPPMSTPKNEQKVATPSSTTTRKLRMMETIPQSDILRGCVAYVDVWADSGLANRSAVFMKILGKMGAMAEKKFTKDKAITHLVFKDGHKLYLKKAKERGVLIVTIEWVDRCRVEQQWVEEKDYLFDDTNYKPPKKFRQLQPIAFEETHQKSKQKVKNFFVKEEQRKARIDRRYEEIINNHGKSKDLVVSSPAESRVLASDTPHVAVHSPHRFFYPHMIAETPNVVLEQRLERVKQGKPIFSPPTSGSDEEVEALPRRLKITPHNRRYRRSRKDSIPCRPPIISNIRLEALKEDDSDFPQSSQESSFKALRINNKKPTTGKETITEVPDSIEATIYSTPSSVGITTHNSASSVGSTHTASCVGITTHNSASSVGSTDTASSVGSTHNSASSVGSTDTASSVGSTHTASSVGSTHTASSVGATHSASSVDTTSSDMEMTCENIRPIYDARNNLVSAKDLADATMKSSQTSSVESNFTLHLSNTEDDVSANPKSTSQPIQFDEYRQRKDTSIQSDTTTACNCSSLDTSNAPTDDASSFKIPSSPAMMTSQSSSSCVTSSKKKKRPPPPSESDVIAARISMRLTIDSGRKKQKEATKKTKEDVEVGRKVGRKAVRRRLCDEIQSPTSTLLMSTSQVDDVTEHDPLISTPIQKTGRKRRKSSFLFAFNPIQPVDHSHKKKEVKISTSTNITVRRKTKKKITNKEATNKEATNKEETNKEETNKESTIKEATIKKISPPQSTSSSSSNQSSQDGPTYRSSTMKKSCQRNTTTNTESPPSFTTRRFTRASLGTAMRREKILCDLYTETDESSDPSTPATPAPSASSTPAPTAPAQLASSTPAPAQSTTTPTTKATAKNFHISSHERIKLNPRSSAVRSTTKMAFIRSTPAKNITTKASLVDTSLEDFISPNSSKAKQRAYHISKKYSIALTGMSHMKRKRMGEVIRQLGGNVVSKLAYADEATHVVTGDGRKTVNIYFAICRGLWIVSDDWIMESWKKGKWLNCAEYEKNYPAGRRNRIFRNKLLPHDRDNWYQQIFLGIRIYISPLARPEPETFKTFVHYCGGSLCGDPHEANICVASSTVVEVSGTIVWVASKWVYDSIYHGEVQSVENYQL